MILGIDAGGTHTRYILMDESGLILEETIRPSIHFMHVGFDGIQNDLKKYTQMMKDKGYNPNTFKVAMGLAGYGEDLTIRKNIEAAVFSVFPSALIYNDAQFAHIAALDNKDGVFIISGTGSIGLKREGDTFIRTGGFGYLLDDAGSAFWIGKKILEVFVKQIDGRLKKTDLFEFLIETLELKHPYDIIKEVLVHKENYRSYVSNLASLTSNLKDTHLLDIYQEAGKALAQLANAFNPQEKTSLSVGGSVLLKNPWVRKSFLKNIRSEYEFNGMKHPVEYAAYILFKKQ